MTLHVVTEYCDTHINVVFVVLFPNRERTGHVNLPPGVNVLAPVIERYALSYATNKKLRPQFKIERAGNVPP